jgi:FxsC-like protein
MSSFNHAATPRRAGPGSYFFLSYAHSPPGVPVPSHPYTSVDPWIHTFFQDLVEAVEHRALPRAGMRAGFIDQEVDPGSDWNATLADALGAAEVFVPLYSPTYFKNPWPMKEHAAFRQRLVASDSRAPGDRIIPVLWIPFPAWASPPEVQGAMSLGDGVPEYADNGLRALCMLSYYRDQYRQVVDRLADRIVAVARDSALTPATDLVLERVPVPDAVPKFVASVLASTERGSAAAQRSGVYGPTSKAWRPFADEQVLPAAEYVASTAERLGLLPTKIADFAASEGLFRAYPTVLLIDPLTLEGEDGEDVLLAVAKTLPPWVRPLVVVDEAAPDSTRADRVAAETVDMLVRAGVAKPARVSQLQEFVDIMPTLVTEARRQFLKHGPVSPPPGEPGTRFRLTDPENPPTTSAGTSNDE